MIGMIWAQAHGRAIGAGGTLPWSVPEDMALFRWLTDGATVIMGRRTWESLPERFRPLPGRKNIVITRNEDYEAPGAQVISSWEQAYKNVGDDGFAWVIGGAQLYEQAIRKAFLLCVTDLDIDVPDADAFAPEIPRKFEIVQAKPARGWLKSSAISPTTGEPIPYRFTLYAPDSDHYLYEGFLDIPEKYLPSNRENPSSPKTEIARQPRKTGKTTTTEKLKGR